MRPAFMLLILNRPKYSLSEGAPLTAARPGHRFESRSDWERLGQMTILNVATAFHLQIRGASNQTADDQQHSLSQRLPAHDSSTHPGSGCLLRGWAGLQFARSQVHQINSKFACTFHNVSAARLCEDADGEGLKVSRYHFQWPLQRAKAQHTLFAPDEATL